jgi:hypothetical protein
VFIRADSRLKGLAIRPFVAIKRAREWREMDTLSSGFWTRSTPLRAGCGARKNLLS